jgi:hypothetical protein
MSGRIAWLAGCAVVVSGMVQAQTSIDAVADEARGYDTKTETTRSWVPVPAVITEPAIGYGLGLAVLNISSSETPTKSGPGDGAAPRVAPPNITGVGGFATGTHSTGVGIGHSHSWNDDRIRYLGVAGDVNLHLSYYGPAENPHSYLLGGAATVQQLLFRVADGNWFVGPRYTFLNARVSFDGAVLPALGNVEAKERVAKAGVVIEYDTRDNTFYPRTGIFAEISPQISRPAVGSSSSFETLSARAFRWIPLSGSLIIAFRADVGFARGAVPFFARPYVSLRGVADAEYQDTNQITGETEIRWYANSDWSFLAFGGLGKAFGRQRSFADAPTAYGFGTGVRYLIVPKLGLTMGLDIARGRNQNAFYIQLGSAWR